MATTASNGVAAFARNPDRVAAWGRMDPEHAREASAIAPAEPLPGLGEGLHRDVLAARAGDRGALGRLHERFAPMVHGLLLSRLPGSEADDLVQDVFVLVIRRLRTLRDAEAFPAWLARLTRNRAASAARRRRPTLRLTDEIEDRRSEPRREEAERVMAVIRALPEAYRETLTLRLAEGMTGPEIALRTGMTHGSVRVNLHRGMAMLRERLAAPRAGRGEEGT